VQTNTAKKTQVSLFYLLKKFPLLSSIHYGFALFSAYGSTQLIFGYLGDALKKGGVKTLKNNASSFLLRLLVYGVTVYLHVAIGIWLEELYTSHLRKKLTRIFLSADFNQAQKEGFILSRFDGDTTTIGTQRQFANNLRKNYKFVLTKSVYATIPSYILVRFIPFLFLVIGSIGGQASGAVLYAKLASIFGDSYGGYESFSSSRKRLNETLASLEKYQTSVPSIDYLPANGNNIIFQQVHFTYPRTKKKILDNFSFNFQKGRKYLITGPNGIGKIVYLANHPYFFNTSLGNNIVYPETYQENLHREALEVTAQKLGIREFIDHLPYRQNLSAGQKQLVSLMRALIRDYEIYLFDEFLSNVNPNLKKHIQKVVFSELKNKTIIVISHEKEGWGYEGEIYEFTPQKLL
ncbi:16102_t:CDS:2, partial [Racocetra fulgida]